MSGIPTRPVLSCSSSLPQSSSAIPGANVMKGARVGVPLLSSADYTGSSAAGESRDMVSFVRRFRASHKNAN
jgi:hypothetical protein